MKPLYQQQKAWFGKNAPCSLSDSERRLRVDPASAICPFYGFTGNKKLLKPLVEAAFESWGNFNHLCRGQFLLEGPSEPCGEVARLFADTVELPFIEIQSEEILIANDILVRIAEVLERTQIIHESHGLVTLELVPYGEDHRYFVIPPCVVFIDDLDSLNRNVMPRLLRAMNLSQPFLCSERGWKANCFNVCWIARGEGSLPRLVERTFERIVLEPEEANA